MTIPYPPLLHHSPQQRSPCFATADWAPSVLSTAMEVPRITKTAPWKASGGRANWPRTKSASSFVGHLKGRASGAGLEKVGPISKPLMLEDSAARKS